jgi:hypothetical protein
LELDRLLRRYALHLRSDPGSTAADSGTVVRLSTARAFASVQEANEFDLYKALGISSGASASEIKVAFRKLAKQLHPDRNPGDTVAEKQFAAVQEAYTILGNADLRAIYDSEMERIRRNVEADVAEQDGGSAASLHRRIWHEVAKIAAVTAVLTACFITGISIWQQNSSGLQRGNTAPPSAGLEAIAPLNVSKEELAEVLFGSQASVYADASAAPGKEVVAANDATAARSGPATPSGGPIATSSEPAVAGNDATIAGIAATVLGSEAKAASVEAAAPGGTAPGSEAVMGSVRAAVIAPAAAAPPTSTEVAIAVEPSPSAREPTARATPSRPLDQARREQAERLIGMGDRHLADGNIAIARQYFARAFDLGFAQAAIRLAETFEAQLLARHGVHGIKPNPAEAEKWRRRALELGQ